MVERVDGAMCISPQWCVYDRSATNAHLVMQSRRVASHNGALEVLGHEL